ncbi:MAG: tyrosine-type recombinase/integrase [Candidatus Obscuribacterales bacterium]
MTRLLGDVLQSFLLDYLPVQKGLRPATIKSYRDVLRLFLGYVSQESKCRLTKLEPSYFTMERSVKFLKWLEEDRHNSVRTRNHRLAVLHSFHEYMATQIPESLIEAQRVAAIPSKRCQPSETFFLEQDEIAGVISGISMQGKLALRDRALILFLYNTGARVQEISNLKIKFLDVQASRVNLHGKGDKWRFCPLWQDTLLLLKQLIHGREQQGEMSVFQSCKGQPLTRFGIYKIVRRHTLAVQKTRSDGSPKSVSPHVFRHSTAVHLLESGVEMNVIRAWLGHVSLDTTNRYAEIHIRAKVAALEACRPPVAEDTHQQSVRWKEDKDLLKWLDSL